MKAELKADSWKLDTRTLLNHMSFKRSSAVGRSSLSFSRHLRMKFHTVYRGKLSFYVRIAPVKVMNKALTAESTVVENLQQTDLL